jgi:hypothetical protein
MRFGSTTSCFCLALFLSAAVSSPTFAAKKPAKAKDDAPAIEGVPPKDAQWTLYCRAVGGIDHVERAKQAKAELVRQTGLKDWYVIHSDAESVIYFGFYRSFNDPKDKKESQRAQGDLKKLTELQDSLGNKYFEHCLFVEVTSPDPDAPPQWDLRNAEGYWSLEIAVYKDSPERKKAAVEAVREARKQGVTAYYFHGPTASSVCIGAWPREAFHDGMDRGGDAVVAPDAEHDLMVLPQPLDPNIQVRNREGQRVREVTPQTRVLDASLQAALQNYPTRALNGEEVTNITKDAQGRESKFTDPSMLVRIPRPQASALAGGAPQPAAPPSLLAPPTQTNGAGKLRSVGQ